MEYVEGITLAWLVKERGPLPIDEACDYVQQAALGLQHAYERDVVHRDIKPDNLIRCSDGTVKILDFGLAALTAERGGGLTEANVVMGTPDYMAPEQAEDSHGADTRADLYSLGCTLHYLLTGKPPYPAPTPMLKILAHRVRRVPSLRRARPDVPPGLAAVVERLLAKRPEDRYQTPRELAAALKPFTRPPAKPRPKRGSLLVAAAVAALFVGIVLAGAAVYRIQTDKGELVITTESDDVKVVITQGGKLVDIVDTKTDKQIKLALRSGEYELELEGAPKGLKLDIDRATLTRGKETLARIERIEKASTQVGEVRRFEAAEGLCGIAISPNGHYLLSTGSSIQLWDLHDGKYVRSFPGHTGRVHAVSFSPDGREFLSCSKDGTMRHWDVETARQLHCANFGVDLYDVVVSPDGRLALAGLQDGTARLWDVKNWKEIRRFVGHPAQLQRVAFSADGRRALTGSWDKTARLWDVETGKELKCFVGHQGYVMGVALSPDGKQALSAGLDKTLRLWDVETGKELRHFEGHPADHAVAFSPDGRFALSGDGSNVRLWEVATGKELHRFDGLQVWVYSVVFSHDGRYALSASPHDRTVRLWRLPDLPPAKKNP
jgi:WD40 repeat protein